jgi:hypothetical protein
MGSEGTKPVALRFRLCQASLREHGAALVLTCLPSEVFTGEFCNNDVVVVDVVL